MGKQAGKRQQNAQALLRRGAGIHGAEQLAPAVTASRSAVLLAPDYADALNNLATALAARGRHADAAAAWERLARLRPGEADAVAGLAAALLADRRPNEALLALAACAGLPPEARLLRLNARALLAMGLMDPALGALHLAVALQPEDHAVHAELATALLQARKDGEALAPALQAFRLAPTKNNAEQLSCVLIRAGHLDAALEVTEAVLRTDPACAEAMVNRSIALKSLGRVAEAVVAARDAVAAAPANPAMRHHLGMTLLDAGALTSEAWDLYEARLKLPGVPPLPPARLWDGGSLDGQTLLIHAEQGLGDTLQFVRYVPLAAARGGRVVLAVQPPLMRLLQGTPGAAEVVPAGAALPAFDVLVPLLSLPRLFSTTLESVPPPLPYGVPQAPGQVGGLRVGLVWAGNAVFADDQNRSMPATAMDGLAGVPGVQFVSLQLGAAALPAGAEDGIAGVQDFADTAARVAGLDLVIAVDTAVAHLAATMGIPVWLLSRHCGCWRWGRGRADSPWYPGLRLFRQSRPGDWDGVVQEVRAALLAWAGAQARAR